MKCKLFFRISLFLIPISFIHSSNSLIDISRNLSSPLQGALNLLLLASFVISGAMGVTTIFMWRKHRENPAIVPLSNVIVLLFLTLVCGFVPYYASKVNGYDIFSQNTLPPDPHVYSKKSQMKESSPKPSGTPSEDTPSSPQGSDPKDQPLWR